MLELLFLLLPIAAAYGWYMGQRSVRQAKQQEADRLSRDYLAGVNFLLSEQQDKAVDLFLDMLKEDSTAFEAHLTLGNLFRSRGEVDRALRIHQSILESASLSFEQRLLVIQQLGKDYMAAGLLDRAEGMFRQLLEEADFRLSALQQLLALYQSTSEWSKAIDMAEKLVKMGKEEQREEIAHFYCELALQALRNEDEDKASSLLKKAFTADPLCPRVSLMQGRMSMAQGAYTQAIPQLERVVQQDSEFISEALPLLQTCYQHLNQPEQWQNLVSRCVERHQSASAELMQADLIEKSEGVESALSYLTGRLQKHPTMRGFYRLMDYHLSEAEAGRAKESLQLLRDMVGEQIRNKPAYRCRKCGFTAHSLYWHCPSCRSWASIKPIQGLDGE